jgi:putative ATPase
MESHTDAPLAERSRPRSFEELVGQEGIWGADKTLRKLVIKDAFNALLFWGPPGSGKTSLAQLIGNFCQRELVLLSAVSCGVKEIRETLAHSEDIRFNGGKSLILFMDEIHRLNKSQQDVLLPALESGLIKFIGATTENPSFEVNNAILSRCLVFRFQKIASTDLKRIMKQAIGKIYPNQPVLLDDAVLQSLADAADGDARKSLNLLDAILQSFDRPEEITLENIKGAMPGIMRQYDKKGDNHYEVISAFIKSIRASHPDAAIYYLARMIDAGEDPMFIARRLVIAASEDIGNANPTALLVASSGMTAIHQVGMPEARIILAQITTYLAASPKSNRSYSAINAALEDVRSTGSLEIPLHLRNAATSFMKNIGYGSGYAYAHEDQAGARALTYLPKELRGRRYYEPSDNGTELQLKASLAKLRPTQD